MLVVTRYNNISVCNLFSSLVMLAMWEKKLPEREKVIMFWSTEDDLEEKCRVQELSGKRVYIIYKRVVNWAVDQNTELVTTPTEQQPDQN